MQALILALVEARLAHERGYMAAYTLRGDAVKSAKHQYAAYLLEALRKDIEEAKEVL